MGTIWSYPDIDCEVLPLYQAFRYLWMIGDIGIETFQGPPLISDPEYVEVLIEIKGLDPDIIRFEYNVSKV